MSVLFTFTEITTASTNMQIVGHRGASEDAPENTLESLKLAWEQGAVAAECDVMLTKDGQIILMHDDSTKRTTGNSVDLLVKNTNWNDLKNLDVGSWKESKWKGVKIPLLRDVLKSIPNGKKLFIEIKSGDNNEGADEKIVEPLLKILNDEKIKEEKIVFISFDHGIIKKLKKIAPKYNYFFITTFVSYPGNWIYARDHKELESVIKSAIESKVDGIDLEYTMAIKKSWIEKIKAAGLQVSIWSYAKDDTLENAKEMQKIGVDFYTTNFPHHFRHQ
ncbi:MAG: hypothetical protein HQK49_05215 [Oligoflexia bacterium]|nr:hypothetical protein [Oligoflexia bacterium]